MDMDWPKFRQHVAFRRSVPPTKAERQIAWLESEGIRFGLPKSEPLERREFGAEDIVLAVARTAERERLERRKREME